MALSTSYRVVEDTPSEVVKLCRKSLNALLDAFAVLVAASQETDFTAFKAAAAGADAALKKVTVTYERPDAPRGSEV